MTPAYEPVRRFRRFKSDFRVKLLFEVDGRKQSEVVRSYEFSQGGVSVYAPVAPQEGELVLELTLPGKQDALRVKAIIRNRRGFRYGMEFAELTKEQEEVLAAYALRLEKTAKN